jgi:hypothetical protein
VLTDRRLLALRKMRPERAFLDPDGTVPGLHARVMPSGHVSFVVLKRFPRNPKNPTPVSLGAYGELTLLEAREKAREWLKLIRNRIDPRDLEATQRQQEAVRRENTVAALAEAYIAEKLPTERKAKDVERTIRKELLPAWGTKPVTDIRPIDGAALVKTVRARSKTGAHARNVLGICRRMFAWGVDQQCYGLTESPFERLRAIKLIGKLPSRRRTLTDDELFALWRAASRLPYPHGDVYRLLTLSALRLNEAADASWDEFDFTRGLWEIPASRMKGKDGDARPHVVPLVPDILALVNDLPRFKGRKYLFSTSSGVKPVWMSSKIKQVVDRRMLRTLRALARRRDEVSADVELKPWVNHDIRRTVRSRLSRLKIAEVAREAVLAHARPGITGVYDQHDYLPEKTEALTLWAKALRDIIEPAPPNVVALQTAGARS